MIDVVQARSHPSVCGEESVRHSTPPGVTTSITMPHAPAPGRFNIEDHTDLEAEHRELDEPAVEHGG
jgi:hypothetical protein